MTLIRSIEGLRGVAALLVALFHVYVYGKWGGLPARSEVLQHAWLFVDLFFVISGFVMMANYGVRIASARQATGYMIRRFFRLYPLHVVTTASVLLAVVSVQTAKWAIGHFGITLGGMPPFAVDFFNPILLVLDVLLLQGVGILRLEIHNYPSWSISVEFWLYLIFALFVLGVRSRLLRITLSLLIVAGCLFHFVELWAQVAPELRTLDTRGLPRGLLSFFQGVLVYFLWSALGGESVACRRPDVDGPIAAGVLSGLQLASAWLAFWLVGRQEALGVAQLAIPSAFALLTLTLLPDRGVVAAALNTRPMQWLGRHSYSIYLVHITVQTLLDWPGRVVPEPAKHLVGLLYLALVFGLAMLTYRYVEVPWRDYGKRIARRFETVRPTEPSLAMPAAARQSGS